MNHLIRFRLKSRCLLFAILILVIWIYWLFMRFWTHVQALFHFIHIFINMVELYVVLLLYLLSYAFSKTVIAQSIHFLISL